MRTNLCFWGHTILLLAIVAIITGLGSHAPSATAFDLAVRQELRDDTPQDDPVKVRCIALECYLDLTDEAAVAELEFIKTWVADRSGISLKVRDLGSGDAERDRLRKVLSAYKVTTNHLPVVYGLNHVVSGSTTQAEWEAELNSLVQLQVFVRVGCSKCAKAKEYLPKFQARYPGLQIEYLDVIENAVAGKEYHELARRFRIGGASVPGFWLCNQLVVGFDNEQSTGARLEKIVQKWTYDCQLPQQPKGDDQQSLKKSPDTRLLSLLQSPGVAASMLFSRQEPADDPAPALPLPTDDLPIPDSFDEDAEGSSLSLDQVPEDEVEVPWIGRISASQLGMPGFTFLIGLIDGFNPCAMWVLLFLLSILVNLRDRWKILAVAGTFVLVSGLAYYAFMAAWLNVLLFVGYLRWVQILLAALAIFVGSVHIKDFFAFKRGLTLSIPESAKPGLYSRVRQIVMAEHLYGAIAGAFVLAVLVNFIELLCTAGLPALYTQVLTLQGYPDWKNYAYLALYIVAYMLDDAIMVGIVVLTLGKRKLQEHEGRWLKLLSGMVIFALGAVLLLKPEWLS